MTIKPDPFGLLGRPIKPSRAVAAVFVIAAAMAAGLILFAPDNVLILILAGFYAYAAGASPILFWMLRRYPPADPATAITQAPGASAGR